MKALSGLSSPVCAGSGSGQLEACTARAPFYRTDRTFLPPGRKRPTSVLTYSLLRRLLFCRFYAKHPVNQPSHHSVQRFIFDLRFNLKCNYNLPAVGAVSAPSGRRGSMRDILREKRKRK